MLSYIFKTLIIGAIALVIPSCQSSGNSSTQPFEMPAVEVDTLTVAAETIPVTFEYVGVVNSYHSVEVRSRVEGVLQKIAYTEGQLVREGELLFVIDPTQYAAALDNAKGALAEQTSNQWNAQRIVERLKPIYEKNAVSHKDLDEAMANVRIADARVVSAAARLKQAMIDLNYTKINAPITGLSGESNYSEGALITPGAGKSLTKISTIDPIYVNFHISESDILKERRETQENGLEIPQDRKFDVQLTLADGTVYSELGNLDFTSPTFSQETGTMMTRALFPNKEGLLRPGQFVRAKMIGAKRSNAIIVPQRAVLQGNKGMFVYLVKDGKAVMQDIEPGEWHGDNWIIKSGLKTGDVVVVDGVDKIFPGSAVTPTEMQPK
jgi:membrane fusion protein (multidrug efflux system)